MNRGRLGVLLAALALATGATLQAGSPTSMNLSLDSAVSIKGEMLAPGDYKLSWKAEGQEAELTIARKGKIVATAKAKVLEKDKPASDDMVVYRKGSNGSPEISEIYRRGEKAVLVLSAS
jgi:hypothetical protein